MNRNLTRSAVTLAAATAITILTAAPAFADVPTVLAVKDLPSVIHNLTSWVIGILAAVATLFLTIGGLRYLAAGGDPAEVEKAKSALKSALVGYALAVLAPLLLGALQDILK
jgi:hypothetical protein